MKRILCSIFLITTAITGFTQNIQINLEPNVIKHPREGVEITEIDSVAAPTPPLSATSTGGSPEVGITDGELSVTPTGASCYSIPLKLPPGINGVAPKIGITYNSQAGNGIAGFGWEIDGISKIEVVAKTIFHNGKIESAQGSINGRNVLSLDGQRLLLKEGASESSPVFETENFSNIRVTRINSGGGFKVDYPDGSFALYGNTPDSNTNMYYAITYWENPQGLSIKYSYTKTNNNVLISTITYGGRYGSNDINTIVFNYSGADRARPEITFLYGLEIIESKFLRDISIYGAGMGEYRKYVLDYENPTSLKYERLHSITEKSGPGFSKSYNPTVFGYQDTPDGITFVKTQVNISIGAVSSVSHVSVSGDFDGDGKMDFLLYPKTGADAYKKIYVFTDVSNPYGAVYDYEQTFTEPFIEVVPITFLSLNNQQQHKLLPQEGWCVIKINSGTTYFTCYSWTPQGISNNYTKSFNFPLENGVERPKQYLLGDFNGDCLTDITVITKYYASTGGGSGKTWFVNLDRRLGESSVFYIGNFTQQNVTRNFTGDYNGDGKTDIFKFEQYIDGSVVSGGVWVYSINSETNSFSPLASYGDDVLNISANIPILFGDYNGDGKTDFLIPKGSGLTEWYKFTSRDTNNFKKEILNFTNVAFSNSIQNSSQYYFISNDYNNDGKSDLLVLSCFNSTSSVNAHAKLTCYLNINGRFDRIPGNYFTVSTLPQTGVDVSVLPVFLSSDKPNKSLEVAFIRHNKIFSFKSKKDCSRERLLEHAITGDGVTKSIFYKPLIPESTNSYNSPNIYTPVDAVENYPNVDIVKSPTFCVVSELRLKSATVDKHQFFTYYGATQNVNGLGFLGFRGTMQTNWFDSSNPMISDVYFNDINLRGALIENFKVLNLWTFPNPSPTSFISKTKNTYNINNRSGAYEDPLKANLVFKLKNTKKDEFNSPENTSSSTIFEYDPFNNPTYVVTNTKQGGTLVELNNTTISYDNQTNSSPYYIGRILTNDSSTTLYPNSPDNNVFSTEEIFSYTNNLLSNKKTRANGSSYYLVEDNQYDPYGNLTEKSFSAPGSFPMIAARTIRFNHDSSNRFVEKSYNVEGQETKYEYDQVSGDLKKVTDPNLLATSYLYDSWGKLTKITDEFLQKSIDYSYTKSSEKSVINITNQNGSAREIILDDLFRKIRTGHKNINGVWSYISYDYDIYDRGYKISEPYFNNASVYTETQYDEFGRIRQINYPNGKQVAYNYQYLTITESDGQKTKTITKNALGMVTSIAENFGESMIYKYFANGSVKSINFGNSTNITTEQDDWGNRTKLVDPSAGTYNYNYNPFGELTSEVTLKGTTSYIYDDAGKLLTKTVFGDYTNSSYTNTYNPSTKLLDSSVYNDLISGTITNYSYLYDSGFRIKEINESGQQAVFKRKFLYDGYGRLDKEYYYAESTGDGKNADKWIKYDYKNGYLWKIIDDLSQKTLWQINSVTEGDLPLSSQYGISSGNFLGIENHTYDQNNLGYPSIITFRNISGPNMSQNPFMKLSTTFNTAKSILNDRTYNIFSTSDPIETFGHDNLNRLNSYPDANGATLNQAYFDDGRIRMNSLGEYRYATSSNIFQQTFLKISEPSVTNYFNLRTPEIINYNVFKKPVSISEDNTEKIDFEYNMFESRSVMYYGDQQSVKTLRPFRKFYSFDGTMEIKRDVNNSQAEFITYIGGDGYSAPIIDKTTFNGSTPIHKFYYLHRDYQGSILGISDDTGALVEKRKFDPWGEVIRITDQYNNTLSKFNILDRGYTGHEHLLEIGLINMNGRLYDPKLHRFLSPDNFIQDPLNSQNYNRYAYVLNSPLSNTDPTGETCNCPEENGGPSDTNQSIMGNTAVTIAKLWDDPGFKNWRKGLKMNDVNTFLNKGGAFIERNLTSIADKFGDAIDRFFGNDSSGPVYTPSGSYSFSSNSNNVNMTSAISQSPSSGFNNSIEGHSFAGTSGLNNASHEIDPNKKKSNIALNGTDDARKYYFSGNGEDKDVGRAAKIALRNSPEYNRVLNRLMNGTAIRKSYTFDVNLTDEVFHIGDTNVDYFTTCSSGNCRTTFKAFVRDGFSDPLDIGIEIYGGTPYNYIPYTFTISYPNPGYKPGVRIR